MEQQIEQAQIEELRRLIDLWIKRYNEARDKVREANEREFQLIGRIIILASVMPHDTFSKLPHAKDGLCIRCAVDSQNWEEIDRLAAPTVKQLKEAEEEVGEDEEEGSGGGKA